MKVHALIFSVVSLFSLSSTFASAVAQTFERRSDHGSDFPRCNTPGVFARSTWRVSIDKANLSPQVSYDSILDMLETEGFALASVIDLGEYQTYFTLSFDPGHWVTPEEAENAMSEVMTTLVSLNGVRVECKAISRPLPGITIRN